MGLFIKSAIILMLTTGAKLITSRENLFLSKILATGAKLITSRESGCASLLKSRGSRMLRENVCKALGDSCIEDCECCRIRKDVARCEKRNKALGYRCYKSAGIGERCGQDHDCRSQKCNNGRCISYFTHVKVRVGVSTCSLTENYIAVAPIKGTIQDNICHRDEHDEPSDPTVDDAAMALDEDSSTIYSNNWAINGGIEVQLKREEGLHSFKVCNSDDCPDCDPTYYRIEGYCQFTNTHKAIQEGPLSLPVERKQCVTVPIAGKPLYSSYRITFPHQRGTCKETCTGECSARPVTDPKHGPCDRHRDDGVNNVGSMTFISKEFEADTTRTIFYYSVDSINLEYAMLSWEGECKVDQYMVYHDVNGVMELETHGCGNDFVLGGINEVHSLCMQGLQIYSDFRKPGNKYMIKVYMIGNIEETTMLPYGMYGKVGTKFQAEYGEVISPKCPADLCKVTCPRKLS